MSPTEPSASTTASAPLTSAEEALGARSSVVQSPSQATARTRGLSQRLPFVRVGSVTPPHSAPVLPQDRLSVAVNPLV